ncbi:hypothetical protein GE061_015475 [Apolygus lucorum]|uniref:Uncharacterized protein n=1 Tax=Apolygus lucorum TaxID=248454 RepID=A0A8S9XNV8_APOLU|nr:hypothetical protein GE061_015475 [Apolygus lucorum]
MKKIQELRKGPKLSMMSPAMKPEEIEELVTRLSSLISMLKSCAKEKEVVSKTIEEHRNSLRMYTSEEYKTKHELSAARMRKTLSESKAALKDCNDRLSRVYSALQDAVSSSTGIKYRKEYKEACKLLQSAKQYLRLAISSSESRPSTARLNSDLQESSMSSVAPEKIVEMVVGIKNCVEDPMQDLEPLQNNPELETATEEVEKISELQIEAVGLLEKECSDKDAELSIGGNKKSSETVNVE